MSSKCSGGNMSRAGLQEVSSPVSLGKWILLCGVFLFFSSSSSALDCQVRA